LINKIVRIIDAKEEEIKYIKEKFEDQLDLIDIEARNAFTGGISCAKIKCYYGFNIVGRRDNKKIIV